MNIEEAEGILKVELDRLMKEPYENLKKVMGGASRVQTFDIEGASGADYDVEIESIWADKEDGNILVHVAVFDKGWASMVPVGGSFVVTADDKILGKDDS